MDFLQLVHGKKYFLQQKERELEKLKIKAGVQRGKLNEETEVVNHNIKLLESTMKQMKAGADRFFSA